MVTSQIKEKDSRKHHSPFGTLKFQLYLAVHTKLKTMFPRGYWEGSNAKSWQLRLMNRFFDEELVFGKCIYTIKNYQYWKQLQIGCKMTRMHVGLSCFSMPLQSESVSTRQGEFIRVVKVMQKTGPNYEIALCSCLFLFPLLFSPAPKHINNSTYILSIFQG